MEGIARSHCGTAGDLVIAGARVFCRSGDPFDESVRKTESLNARGPFKLVWNLGSLASRVFTQLHLTSAHNDGRRISYEDGTLIDTHFTATE